MALLGRKHTLGSEFHEEYETVAMAENSDRETRRRAVLGVGCALGATAFGAKVLIASGGALAANNDGEILVPTGNLKDEVQRFLTAYNEGFETFDATKIAPFYHVPCITVRGDGSIHSFQSRSDIEKFFQGVAEKYAKDGYRGGSFYDLEVLPIGSRSALATLTWEQLREDKSILRKWRHSYNLIRVENGWQILASTFHLA